MQYDQTKRKIRKCYDGVNNAENKITQLKQYHSKFSINYKNGIVDYSTDWIKLSWLNLSAFLLVINLKEFPEEIIGLLRITPCFKTTVGFLNDTSYLNFVPTITQGLEKSESDYLLKFRIKSSFVTFPIHFKVLVKINNQRV